MEMKVTAHADHHIASIGGRVDAATAGDFEGGVRELIEQGAKNIVLDMSALSYINSAGIRSFLLLAKAVRAGKGKMCIAGLQPSVKEVFDISGFGSMFAFFPSLEAALEAGLAGWR